MLFNFRIIHALDKGSNLDSEVFELGFLFQKEYDAFDKVFSVFSIDQLGQKFQVGMFKDKGNLFSRIKFDLFERNT